MGGGQGVLSGERSRGLKFWFTLKAFDRQPYQDWLIYKTEQGLGGPGI